MTVDEETKLDVVAKTKKSKEKQAQPSNPTSRTRRVQPNRQSHEIHAHFIHLSIHPKRSPEPEPEEPSVVGCSPSHKSTVHDPRNTPKKKGKINPPSSRAAARVQSARGFSHPSNHPLDVRRDRCDRRTGAPTTKPDPLKIYRSIHRRARAHGRTDARCARSRASAHTRSTTRPTDADDPRFRFVHKSTVREPSNIQWVGSTDRQNIIIIQLCVSAHPSNHPTHPRRRDATRMRTYFVFSFVI